MTNSWCPTLCLTHCKKNNSRCNTSKWRAMLDYYYYLILLLLLWFRKKSRYQSAHFPFLFLSPVCWFVCLLFKKVTELKFLSVCFIKKRINPTCNVAYSNYRLKSWIDCQYYQRPSIIGNRIAEKISSNCFLSQFKWFLYICCHQSPVFNQPHIQME